MKRIILVLIMVLSLALVGCGSGLKKLPAPELDSGIRGEQFGIDKNINEATIDEYLGRSDAVYRDVRMLKDPAKFEAIGLDSHINGFVKGFEVVPYPLLVNVMGLPAEIGESYTGPTLFTQDGNGNYVANYVESMEILEYLFPKDKVIFIMCGAGGYAGMTKAMLVALGWDANKLYNIGGYSYYEGNNNVITKRTLASGEVVYDFYKVAYHEIEFDKLTKK